MLASSFELGASLIQGSIFGNARMVKNTDPEDESTISEKGRA